MNGKRALIAALALLGACDRAPPEAAADEPAAAAGAPVGEVLARVEERAITEAQVAAFARLRGRPEPSEEAREWALAELIDLNLLAAEAEAAGLVDAELEAELQVQRLSILANRAAAEFNRSHPVSEAELSAEYERQVNLTGRSEYRLEHILLPERGQAEAVIARLAGGENFTGLVTEYAAQVGAANAGDLGWVNLAQVPAAFADPVRALAPGAYAARPIQSEYGWHVVYLSGVREFEPPAFEVVKDGIRNTLARRKMERHLSSLRARASISRETQEKR